MFGRRDTAPTIHQPDLVLIQYPGIVRNMDRAMQTLGGLAHISQNHFSNRSLELRHTPENPYTSCLVSEKKVDATVTSGTLRIVMKIRRKRSDPTIVEARCLGLVNYVYTFDSMVDFQYLPIKLQLRKVDGVNVYSDLLPRLVPTDLASALSWWTRPESESGPTLLYLPPFQFSRYNTPSTKILCRETDFSTEKTRKKTGHGQNLRTERKALSITVHAADPFPAAPTQDAIDDANFRCKNEEPHRLMTSLFDERPMWTRVAIQYRTGLEDTLLKSLLQKYAFYVQSGPWGRLWCRFGYDPRETADSKNYQTLMVSFRQHTKIPERQRLKVSTERCGNTGDLNVPINYTYQQGRLPRVRQMWYSLCDIQLPQAEALLKRDFSNAPDPATSGWIHGDVLEELRDLVKMDVKKTSDELDLDDEQDIADDF